MDLLNEVDGLQIVVVAEDQGLCDGLPAQQDARGHLIFWEAKSVVTRRRGASVLTLPRNRSWSLRDARTWLHLTPWLTLGLISIIVPRFFMMLVFLLGALSIALLGFVLLIQFPMRYLAIAWQQGKSPRPGRRGVPPSIH